MTTFAETRLELKAKAPGATATYTFDFLSSLLPAESLSAATVTVTVYSGTDTNPSAVFVSRTLVGRSQVAITLDDGLGGVMYSVTCTATSNLSNIYTMTGILPVLESL